MAYPRYRPTFVDRLMVRTIRKTLPNSQRRDFDADLQHILQGEADFLTDKVTAGHILFAAAVLCHYRRQRAAGVPDKVARATLARTLSKLGKTSSKFFIWLYCRFSRDPFAIIQKYSRFKTDMGYGPSFEIDLYEIENGYVSEVQVCGYRTFLARHHALDLTELLCEWDRVWIDALPSSIDFHRPATLGQGGASCRFEFRRPVS